MRSDPKKLSLKKFVVVALPLVLGACASSQDTFLSPSALGFGDPSASLAATTADAQRFLPLRTAPRLALVVGNSHYDGGWGALEKTTADARAMAEVLRASGYALVGGGPLLDVDEARLNQSLAELEQQVRKLPGAVVVVYFAGHGIGQDGGSYLVPVRAPVAPTLNPGRDLVAVRGIADRLSAAGAGAVVMFLDACRAPGFTGQLRGLQKERGLPANVFIGYAADFGGVAREEEDQDPNGNYTGALIRKLKAPFDTLADMHLAVAMDVIFHSQGLQHPVYEAAGDTTRAPIRFGSDDPQARYAAALRDGQGSSTQAIVARCEALTDFLSPIVIAGRVIQSVSIPAESISVCRQAVQQAPNDSGALSGLAIATMLGDKSTDGQLHAGALLSQAAELGDPTALFWDAFVYGINGKPSSPSDKDLMPTEIEARRYLAFERFKHAAVGGEKWAALLLGGDYVRRTIDAEDGTRRTASPFSEFPEKLRPTRAEALSMLKDAAQAGLGEAGVLAMVLGYSDLHAHNAKPVDSDQLRLIALSALNRGSFIVNRPQGRAAFQALFATDLMFGKLGEPLFPFGVKYFDQLGPEFIGGLPNGEGKYQLAMLMAYSFAGYNLLEHKMDGQLGKERHRSDEYFASFVAAGGPRAADHRLILDRIWNGLPIN